MESCVGSLLPLAIVAIGRIFAISEVRYSGKGNLVKISNWFGPGGWGECAVVLRGVRNI